MYTQGAFVGRVFVSPCFNLSAMLIESPCNAANSTWTITKYSGTPHIQYINYMHYASLHICMHTNIGPHELL